MLQVVDARVSFDGQTVLNNASLSVGRAETVALLGPSGSGKSTLLRAVAGLVALDSGQVIIDGDDVTNTPTHVRSVGMVFQDEQLFPHLDVAANIGFGLKMSGVPKADRAVRVDELLDLVGLVGFARRTIDHLSGGEAKRVALARSLAPDPRVLLLDEPLTGLDRELQHRLADDLATVLTRTSTTAVWVTHDEDEARRVATRTVRMGDL